MKILLDTNVYSEIMRGNPTLAAQVKQAEKIFMSTAVVGELLFGFRNGNRFDKNRTVLAQFLNNPFVELLSTGYTTADRFGRIASALRKKGKPIPTNDIWIAAHTMESGADLYSYDHHFSYVDGLSWVKPDG